MSSAMVVEIDFIEELRLRRWARENYAALADRQETWHPIILEEMSRKDQEVGGRGGSHPHISAETR